MLDRLVQVWPAEDTYFPAGDVRHEIGHRGMEPTIEALRQIANRYRSMGAVSDCPIAREGLRRIAVRYEGWADRLSSSE